MNEFIPNEYEINTLEPESMSVGKLNQVVRALREKLYQENIKKWDLINAAQVVTGKLIMAVEAAATR